MQKTRPETASGRLQRCLKRLPKHLCGWAYFGAINGVRRASVGVEATSPRPPTDRKAMRRCLGARGTVAGPTAQPSSIAFATAWLVSVRARRIVPEYEPSTRVGGCVSTTRPRRASGAMSWTCVPATRGGETSNARATQAGLTRRGRALARRGRGHLPLPLAEAARGRLATRDARPGQRSQLDARLAALPGFRSLGGGNKVHHVALHPDSNRARGGEGRGHG